MTGFREMLLRDLALARRQSGESLLAILFFVLGAVLFPLGIGPEPNLLAATAAGLLWVMALLATLLSLERLFALDREDGSLDLIVLAPQSLTLIVLGKAVAHWLTTGLGLVLAAPLLAVLLNMEGRGFGVLLAAMALGTPVLSLLGTVGAALTVGARRGGVLLTLLVLPLYVPVLIFGAGAVEVALAGMAARGHLMVLGALLLASVALCPWAAAAALKQATE